MTYYLVQSDTAAAIKGPITSNYTGLPIPLTNETIVLKFKARNTTTILFTLTGTGTPTELAEGIVTFSFGNNLVDLPAGFYDGEIEITYQGGSIESVYEVLKFQVREDF